MDEEKFSTVGESGEPEKKGFRIKVITLLFIILIIAAGAVIARTVIRNKMREREEKIVSGTVIYELNRIKSGDEEALEKYLKYSDLLNDSAEEELENIETEEVEEENNTKNEKDVENTDKIEKIEDNIKNEKTDLKKENDKDNITDAEEDDKIFKTFLSSLNYEITSVNIEKNTATATARITNKDSGDIFRNYFTRAIKLAINQALSSSKNDDGKLESELQEYLEEQVVSDEIPVVTSEVIFNLKKENNVWEVTGHDKDMVDVIFPNLVNVISELGEQYGEYGD